MEPGSGFENIIKAAQIATYDEKKKRKYNEEIMFERDFYSQMETYTRIGHDAGLEEGRAEGEAKGKAEVISKLLISGMAAEVIAQILDMTEEEVKAMLPA